jgi:type II secretory pathway pseudopilin PulG
MTKEVFPETCRGVRRGARLTNCTGAWHTHRYNAFTLIELVLVVGIITVLAGLVLSTVGYVRKKGARARAEAEIAVISAACENYKADNGVYPRDCATTSQLNSATDGNPAHYATASRYMYGELAGDRNFDGTTDSGAKSYMIFSLPLCCERTCRSRRARQIQLPRSEIPLATATAILRRTLTTWTTKAG